MSGISVTVTGQETNVVVAGASGSPPIATSGDQVVVSVAALSSPSVVASVGEQNVVADVASPSVAVLVAGVGPAAEWTADTVSLAEAQSGTETVRRAWTAQRVRQAIVAWWSGVESQYALASDELTAIGGLNSALNTLPYFTGPGTAATTPFTPFARTLLDDGTPTTARATLQLGSIATQAANNVNITGGSIVNADIDGGQY